MINAVFIQEEIIFVALFQSEETTHWHFFYSIKYDKMIGEPIATKLNCSTENFLFTTFYNPKLQEFYCIYRLGECITIKCDHLHEINHEECNFN